MDGYVSKPIQPQELFDTIDRLLPPPVAALPPGTANGEGEGGAPLIPVEIMDRAQALNRVGGDLELLKELGGEFLGSYPEQLDELRAALGAATARRCSDWPTRSRGRSASSAPAPPSRRRCVWRRWPGRATCRRRNRPWPRSSRLWPVSRRPLPHWETDAVDRPLAAVPRSCYFTPLYRPAIPPSLRERTHTMPRRLACLALLLLAPCAVLAAADPNAIYKLGPDSMEKPDVPHGKVTQMPPWKSKIFDGTVRDCWVYVPAQYDGDQAGLRHGLPGRRRLSERQGRLPRADRLRQPDPPEGDAGDHRHLHQPGHVPPPPDADKGAKGRRTAASSTTRSPTSMPASCEKEILPEVGKTLQAAPGRRGPGDLRHQLRRHLRLHRRLGAAGPVQQGAEPRRQLHQHPRRRRLSRPDPQDGAEADPRLPPGRLQRPRQPARQLAAGAKQWRRRWRSPSTTTSSSSATAATTASTAAPSCRTRCAGCGGTRNNPNEPQRHRDHRGKKHREDK